MAALTSGCSSWWKGPCEDDLGRYCGLEKEGTEAYGRCVEKFSPKFSDKCQKHLQEKGK